MSTPKTFRPIQIVVDGRLEWFQCSCGNKQFKLEDEYMSYIDPHLGVLECTINCSCGKRYEWAYGYIYSKRRD